MVTRARSAARAAALRSRRMTRVAAVFLGVLAALAVWGLVDLLGGDVRQPTFGPGTPQEMTPIAVVVASAVAGGAAWLALAVLERFTRHARNAWLVIASVTLVVSLGGPLSGQGIDGAERLALVLMHLAVGAVVIGLLSTTSPPTPHSTKEKR